MNDKLIDELRTQYNEMTEEPKITGAGYWAEYPETGIISPEPNTITMVTGSRTLLTFRPDGRVDGDVADASETARVFCETVSHLFGKTTPSQPDASALVEAVKNLETAIDALAATRSHSTYLSMIDNDNAAQALLRLDGARQALRTALTAWEAQHG
ncbi:MULTISPECIES: hypothetical protein [Sphingomonadales]|jgi:hypothetical protein|uniref:hypothetical protein n=1 Tax=Sphingomonadales TaxID=204457 RepID=UPI0008258BB3|nr:MULTISPECIES: hypothetical protein [Sphingomonadales]